MVRTTSGQLTYEYQESVDIAQANPVSTTEYEVLAETPLVKLLSIYAESTGGTVQNLQVIVYIDGVPITFSQTPPATGVAYSCEMSANLAEALQVMNVAMRPIGMYIGLEGKTVRVTAVVTWTVQPSPLECRVYWEALR